MRILKKQLIIGIVFIVIFLSLGTNIYAIKNKKIVVNGEDFHPDQDVIILNGRTYIPVRDFTELLGAYVQWDSATREVSILNEDGEINFKIDSDRVVLNNKVMYMDSKAVIINKVTCAPVRFIAEAFKHEVKWIAETSTIAINEIPYHIVKKDDTLVKLSETYDVSIEDIKAWNELTSDQILIHQKLYFKQVILNAVNEVKTKAIYNYTEEEFEWLAKIIYAEANDEPYEGLVAVGAVVLNRVKDSSFPNTIKDVIFQKSQFTPVKDGRLYKITPDSDAYRAAKDALMGVNPVEGALFFNNPRTSRYTSFFGAKQVIANIGNHRFYH